MDDFTRKFKITMDKDAEIHQILTAVYQALEEKGYNPINQIVGYILSEDPTYITNHNNARTLIRKTAAGAGPPLSRSVISSCQHPAG